jgi:hypothetical protein
MSKRKTLRPVDKLVDKTPITTAAVRKNAQAANREVALAHELADSHVDWILRVARGEIEAPTAVQVLAVKTANDLLLGLEEARDKKATDKVTINIVGMSEERPIVIEGEAKEVPDE